MKKIYFDIFKKGFFSIFLVTVTSFFCAPNLFTNMPQTIHTLQNEARSVHLGADGLGFFGNLNYYLTVFINTAGYEAVFALVAGIFWCVRKRSAATLSMGMGMIFWICTSVLALHWERWGMPIYIFFVILTAIGISYLYSLSKKKFSKIFICTLGAIIFFNSAASSLILVQKSITTEARVDAIQFCKEHGITKDNSLYEGYTPFLLNAPGTIKIGFDAHGKLSFPANIKYLILSSEMYNRYYAEPIRYAQQVNKYENIQNDNELIYSAGGPYYSHSNFATINIIYAIKGLFLHSSRTKSGCRIKIYRIRRETEK